MHISWCYLVTIERDWGFWGWLVWGPQDGPVFQHHNPRAEILMWIPLVSKANKFYRMRSIDQDSIYSIRCMTAYSNINKDTNAFFAFVIVFCLFLFFDYFLFFFYILFVGFGGGGVGVGGDACSWFEPSVQRAGSGLELLTYAVDAERTCHMSYCLVANLDF